MLGGYSFGGLVADEIALHLQAAGKEVALLVLFDAFNPSKLRLVRSWTKIVRDTTRARFVPWDRVRIVPETKVSTR
jgi:thioesterase domain-containing protein